MTEQETLLPGPAAHNAAFDPEAHHLFGWVIDTDGLFINIGRWNRARADNSYVGQCRWCGGYLLPEPSDAYSSSPDDVCGQWLGAVCISCGQEFVAPDAKVLQRSARHSRMPRQFLRTRAGLIAEPRSQGG